MGGLVAGSTWATSTSLGAMGFALWLTGHATDARAFERGLEIVVTPCALLGAALGLFVARRRLRVPGSERARAATLSKKALLLRVLAMFAGSLGAGGLTAFLFLAGGPQGAPSTPEDAARRLASRAAATILLIGVMTSMGFALRARRARPDVWWLAALHGLAGLGQTSSVLGSVPIVATWPPLAVVLVGLPVLYLQGASGLVSLAWLLRPSARAVVGASSDEA